MEFTITRVVTRNIVVDAFQGIRNFFGKRLRGYEEVITKAHREMIEEMNLRYENIKWWRINQDELTSGAILITFYGNGELR